MTKLANTMIGTINSIGRVILIGLFLASTSSPGEGLNNASPPSTALATIKEMPSFDQRDDEFNDGGLRYCGPTAAANALIWLADHGYPRLRPKVSDEQLAQKELIKQLAAFMGVHRDGSTSSGFLCGVKTYVRSQGYTPGIDHLSGQALSNGRLIAPDLALLNESMNPNTVAWLGLGIYHLDPHERKLRRISGHMVTLAGVIPAKAATGDAVGLIISDPEFPGTRLSVELAGLDAGLQVANGSRSGSASFRSLIGWTRQPSGPETTYRVLESIQSLSLEPDHH